jgi:tyrosyl-tRNA synthetase
VASISEVIRQIGQNAVRLNCDRVTDKSLLLDIGHSYLLQVGKRRVARVTIRP